MKKFLIFSILFFSYIFCIFAEEITTIKIENAQKTEYRKSEETENETIYLDGNVELSVEKGGVKTEIKADIVSYDRVTKMLYASGNIHLISTGSAAGDENIYADTLILNTSTLEGVFDGGRVIQTQSDAINLPSGSTLVVFSNMFGKSESNILSFKNASMTFCDDEDPHWKINASRMWLLSGGEFAFLNALLYVGKVPVLYLPAFYYPKDELIFNPVIGYHYREGFYVQTTSYLIGRKPLNSSSLSKSSSSSSDRDEAEEALKSLYNFMKPSSLKVQEREGLVLHNKDEDYKGDTSKYLKIKADWYSNLGYMVGVDGSLTPKDSVISKLVFGLDLGLTNTIYKNNGVYSPYSISGEKVYDDSNFLSLKLPFRYKGNFEFAITKPFRLSLSLPIYSDPFFGYDFGDRSEDLNWITSIKEFIDNTDDNRTSSEVSSFAWNLNGSWSPSLPAYLKPYINSVSLTSNSAVSISSTSTDSKSLQEIHGDSWNSYTPRRRFYYPSQVTPAKVTANVSGTLFQYPKKATTVNGSQSVKPAFDLNKPGLFSEPETNQNTENRNQEESSLSLNSETTGENNESGNTSETDSGKNEDTFLKDNYTYPSFTFTLPSQAAVQGFTYNLSYSLNSTLETQISYASEGLKTPEDFDWRRLKSSMYSLKAPLSLNSTMNYGGSFLTMNNKLSYDPLWQGHPYISTDKDAGGYTEGTNGTKYTLQKADYSAEKQDILNTNTLSFNPFVYIPAFSETGISWNTNIKLFRREFLGDPEDPQWDNQFVEWNEKAITINNVTMTLAANELQKTHSQKLVFTASLPPQQDKYSATLNLTFPHLSTSLSTGFYKTEVTENDGAVTENWKKNPLQQSATFSWPLLGSNLSLSESYNYNLEDKENESFKTSISWKGVSLAYTMSMTNTYNFEPDGYDEDGKFKWGEGWVQDPDKDFVPYSISASYSVPSKTFYSWRNRVSFTPSLSTNIVADLVRPTNSYFTISPSLTFKLNEFLNLSFSATSRNSVIYRYFQNMMGQDYEIPGEKNMLVDLMNSFRFDNDHLRQASGFKLKSLDLTMDHELHDWKFQLKAKMEPVLKNIKGQRWYDFTPYLSIGVIWNPMENIKTTPVYKFDENLVLKRIEDGGKGYDPDKPEIKNGSWSLE